MGKQWKTLFLGAPKSLQMVIAATKLRRLLLGKAMTNLDRILKSKDITLPTKVRLVKAMVFPVVMYRCESWTIKKAECQRIDAFKLWCWRRLLRVPWTAKRSNQSILKEISPECSLQGLMLKLKLQYFGHPMRRTDSFEKTLMLGKIEGGRRRSDRGWDGWMASPTQWTLPGAGKRHSTRDDGHGFQSAPGVGDRQGGLACCGSWGHKELDTTERLNWTELKLTLYPGIKAFCIYLIRSSSLPCEHDRSYSPHSWRWKSLNP